MRPHSRQFCNTPKSVIRFSHFTHVRSAQQLLSTLYKLTDSNCTDMTSHLLVRTTYAELILQRACAEKGGAKDRVSSRVVYEVTGNENNGRQRRAKHEFVVATHCRDLATGNCGDVRLMTSHSVNVTTYNPASAI